MEKQTVQTPCFEEVFLDFLRLRFEFEPLPHYVMAAIHVCEETSRNYPDFVRGFLAWFADGFLFERGGTFPAQSHNTDPADKRWRRYADCHALLEGWLEDDLKAALEAQAERLELVERVAQLRQQEREDGPGKAGRGRAKATKTDAEVFADLEDWFGVKDYMLKRQHKALIRTPGIHVRHLPARTGASGRWLRDQDRRGRQGRCDPAEAKAARDKKGITRPSTNKISKIPSRKLQRERMRDE